ncbi:MAG TPA: DUF2249 domain-containing protein [Candidatus Baltobacteraceae bacterium]|nr:DUF2249 domain-containing protein [Candidatus Baltobacteraceae bacterium]
MKSTVLLDNRGLSPPEPMLRILSALETLAPGGEIVAQMDRRPIFLFPELDERGCTYACDAAAEGGYVLTICKS